MITIETARLVLRRWREEDVASFAAINADPDVMRWIGDGSVRDLDETRAGIARAEAMWEAEGFGLFAVVVRESGALAGFAGFSVPEFMPEVMPAVEIGWRFGKSFWGNGLATEAARAALDFGVEECGLERVVSIVQVGNSASENIVLKLGMRLDREVADGRGRRRRVYAITASEYRAGRSGG